ncbi:MAG: TlpA family protein disulfide reductase [Chloroflexi bacterium]|nr:TlpA family protein disulfide reductase [Chloroflexota bacterium]MDK1046075.1 TlpA disulfide reductase family protein [Anaerolineales bacterium]MCH8094053.1 TlpA family protein disulfide reductase [Chloroflexota bacterium]MCH8341615.1 TlpA family protein disulfide reductase [Chloroflexota bacterium]MCH8875568.1 TlpA family protein disulfide reductase [Chloroflexota bacterium]
MSKFESLVRDPIRWGATVLGVVVLGAIWIAVSQVPASATTGGAIPSPREGFLAPDFTLETLQGETVTLSDLRGKAVVVNLWASWCPPCRAEMPALQAAYEADRGRGLEILAVDMTYQDTEQDALRFIEEFGLTFTIPMDRDGTVARQYLLRALPSTFFVGPDGVITKVVIGGPMSEATIRTNVQAMLDELP